MCLWFCVLVLESEFQQRDVDNSGTIDSQELEECLHLVGFAPTQEDIDFLITHFDQSGTASYMHYNESDPASYTCPPIRCSLYFKKCLHLVGLIFSPTQEDKDFHITHFDQSGTVYAILNRELEECIRSVRSLPEIEAYLVKLHHTYMAQENEQLRELSFFMRREGHLFVKSHRQFFPAPLDHSKNLVPPYEH